MNDTDRYILEAIRVGVWSGFLNEADVQRLIDDILEDDADEAMLRAAVTPEFAKKAEAEADWPDVTDCDRLDQAFDALDRAGMIALQNAGYTMSDGLDDVGDALHRRGRTNARGYCFYHGQDVERAVDGHGLMIAFGDLDAEVQAKTSIGQEVLEVLREHGLAAEWDGDPENRISLPLDWKRRYEP